MKQAGMQIYAVYYSILNYDLYTVQYILSWTKNI